MRRLRISDLVAGFLLGFATLLVIFILSSDFAAYYEVCETTKEGAKECTSYNVMSYTFHKIGAALDSYNGLITAAATAFIAWFTLSLRQSTDKLWDAGERQLALLAESGSAQARDMQASINEAVRAATAMERLAASIEISAKAAVESVATVREVSARQMRAYLSVLLNTGIYQEREHNLKFDVRPLVYNSGNTPAHKFTYWANAKILPNPLPHDFDFPVGTDTLKAGFVLGPHQNIILNATAPDFISDDEVEEVKRGIKRRITVWGVVFYEDVFGEKRETRFCHSIYWVRGEKGESISGNYAPRHNDAT